MLERGVGDDLAIAEEAAGGAFVWFEFTADFGDVTGVPGVLDALAVFKGPRFRFERAADLSVPREMGANSVLGRVAPRLSEADCPPGALNTTSS